MQKFILNIVLLAIIAFSLSIIPLNGKLIDFENIWNKSKVEEEETSLPTYSYQYDNKGLENPKEAKFSLLSSLTAIDFDESILIDVYSGDNLVKSVSDNSTITDFEKIETEEGSRLDYTIDVSMDTMKLSNGDYEIHIYSYDEKFDSVDKMVIPVKYEKNYTYYPMKDESEEFLATMYVPTQDFAYIIPVSLPVDDGKWVARAMYDKFESDSIEVAGLVKPVIPDNTFMIHEDNTLTVKFTAAEVESFNESQLKANNAINIIKETFTRLPDIDRVLIRVNGRVPDPEKYFSGVDLTSPLVSGDVNVPYLTYAYGDLIYLLPDFARSGATTDYMEMWELLKGKDLPKDLLASVPPLVKLDSATLLEGVLTLKVNLGGVSLSDSAARLLIDAAVMTYSSFEEVESVKLDIDGNAAANLAGIDLSVPLVRQKYINAK